MNGTRLFATASPATIDAWNAFLTSTVTEDRLAECQWPTLATPYAEALREAVAFAMEAAEPLGIIATGTIVRGTADASSDLDVYVIHDAAHRRRVQHRFSNVPTEIFINPPSAVRRYFAEEHREGRPITAHMIATGSVVFSTGGVVDDLRREASEWLAWPSPLSDEQLVRARYAAATRFEDAVDVGDIDPATATMLSTQAIMSMLELHCRTALGRIPRSKDLLGSIDAIDAELGQLVHTFFAATSWADRQRTGESIADRTIGARGFFEWDSGPEAVQ